jgi:hypothetical protein
MGAGDAKLAAADTALKKLDSNQPSDLIPPGITSFRDGVITG